MNSLAIWDDNERATHIEELHLNYWLSNDKSKNYIELAFLISEYSEPMKLNIFLPFVIENKNLIGDKTKDLAINLDLSSAMFNEKLQISSTSGQFSLVNFLEENNKDFYYFLPNEDTNIDLVNQNKEGSIITVDIPKLNEKSKIYFRLRINDPSNLLVDKLDGNIFQDGLFKKTSFLEININSIRKLPSHIVQKLNNIKINKIQVFIMTDVFNEVTFSSQSIKSSRILENHIWDNYIDNRSIKRVIAHQWTHKKEQGMDDYNLFIVSKKLHFTVTNILITAFIILFFSTLAEISASYISDFFQQKQEVDINATKQ